MQNRILPFLIVSLGEIIIILFHVKLEWLFKPLLMITLGIYYYTSLSKTNQPLSKSVVWAIVFSLLGDVALMFQPYNELYFIIGLGSFLIAHLFYLNAYHQHRNEVRGTALLGIQKFRFSLPIVLYGTGLITVLYSNLGDFKIPVILYSLVLILMVLQALFRFGHTARKSFVMVFIGALLFMISDSLIAINKFLSSFESAQLAIMGTYITAQLLIIKGLIAHSENSEK